MVMVRPRVARAPSAALPAMRVILTSHGSTGDIYPLIALGRALLRAGHTVGYVALPAFQREIEGAGISFIPAMTSQAHPDLRFWMGRLMARRTPLGQLLEAYRAFGQHLPETAAILDREVATADLLVSSYLFPLNRGVADRQSVPFATFAFAHHVVPSPDYPPERMPSPAWLGPKVRRAWNRWLWRTADRVADALVNRAIAGPLRAAGLPGARGFFSTPADCVLVGVSESLMRPAGAGLDPRFHFSGYCRWQSAVEPAIDAELPTFTGGDRVPVLTFGSMVDHDPTATLRRFLEAWPRDRRIILQHGWTRFEVPAGHPQIRVVGKVSHDQLFAHASVVIHHGGAGTTASALHAGVPQIIVPHIADQAFFGREIERLGCGFRLSRRRWPERLAGALDRLEADQRAARRAAEVRRQLQREDGPARAVTLLENFVAEQHRRRAEPAAPTG